MPGGTSRHLARQIHRTSPEARGFPQVGVRSDPLARVCNGHPPRISSPSPVRSAYNASSTSFVEASSIATPGRSTYLVRPCGVPAPQRQSAHPRCGILHLGGMLQWGTLRWASTDSSDFRFQGSAEGLSLHLLDEEPAGTVLPREAAFPFPGSPFAQSKYRASPGRPTHPPTPVNPLEWCLWTVSLSVVQVSSLDIGVTR